MMFLVLSAHSMFLSNPIEVPLAFLLVSSDLIISYFHTAVKIPPIICETKKEPPQFPGKKKRKRAGGAKIRHMNTFA